MSKGNGEVMSVKIVPNDSSNPPGKLADAEVIFEAGSGPLYGGSSASVCGNVAMEGET